MGTSQTNAPLDQAQNPKEVPPESGQPAPDQPWWRDWVKPVTIVGVAILIAFIFVFNFMLAKVVAPADQWERYLHLYATVEALVTAAAGALLGTTVQVSRVQQANQDKQEAKRAAGDAAADRDAAKTRQAESEKREGEVTAKGESLRAATVAAASSSRDAAGRWVDLTTAARFAPDPADPGKLRVAGIADSTAVVAVPVNTGTDIDPALTMLEQLAKELFP
jgi:hypothetical protein